VGSNSVAEQVANPLGSVFGQNTVVGQVGQYTNLLGIGISAANALAPPSSPQPQSPSSANTPTPTLASTNTTALQSQLSNEQNAASTSTILTGGQGLLDQPTTTSKVLLGS
jgi:hypothetical protein